MISSRIAEYFAALLLSFAILAIPVPRASGQGIAGVNIIIRLRLTGESQVLPQLRACLSSRLSHMPDVEIATQTTQGERFIVDVITAKGTDRGISASLVVAETFPVEELRPGIKRGEETDALLATIPYYTLLRLHEVVLGRTAQSVCTKIVTVISDRLLSEEYTERDD
jgi:hypothetical protein